LLHYKVCSTFDSSPALGSIGAAIDVAQELVGSPFVPVMPAAPRLNRWVAFANLFARSGPESPVYRLDRHPTMRQHPATPMDESDLRVVLGRQTERPVGSLDLVDLQGGRGAVEARLEALADAGVDTVICDTVEPDHVALLALTIWEHAVAAGPLLAVASAGLEHGLAAVWRGDGELAPPPSVGLPDADVALAVCGSRSPVSDAQIARAVAQGWAEVALDLRVATQPELFDGLVAQAAAQAVAALERGRSAIVHTAGTELAQDAGTTLRLRRLEATGRRRLGEALGAVADRVTRTTPVRRLAVAGGDSSGDVLRRLGVRALEVTAAFSPAMPFCRVHGTDDRLDELELICKGGQTGTVDFFDEVRRGRPTAPQPTEVLA
ncbi:MAG TPA: four-carbon acid sugar kinase family protein, partial [Conexibacter sp.]|nr:four-carbon acid sugar kinase family protein [Conexibacter sp.]